MNIDTTAINPASATTLLPIPCLPFLSAAPGGSYRATTCHYASSVSSHFSSAVNSDDAGAQVPGTEDSCVGVECLCLRGIAVGLRLSLGVARNIGLMIVSPRVSRGPARRHRKGVRFFVDNIGDIRQPQTKL
jgi:hypothetical protein